MSSSSSSSTPSSLTASSATATSDPTDDGFSTRGAANYFFGFLFLFAVILLIFVGCGIGSRRRLLSARRVNPQTSLEPWSSPGSGGEVTPPKFHEATFVVAQAAAGWKDIMPLSVAYLSSSEQNSNNKSATDDSGHSPLSITTSDQPLSPPPPSDPTNFSTFARTFLPTLRKTSSGASLDVPATEVRVAILIAMPSHQGHGAKDRHVAEATASSSETSLPVEASPEIQIGVETLPSRER